MNCHLAKCAAGPQRDWDYAAAAIRAELVDPDVLLERVPDLPVGQDTRSHIAAAVRGIVGGARAQP